MLGAQPYICPVVVPKSQNIEKVILLYIHVYTFIIKTEPLGTKINWF